MAPKQVAIHYENDGFKIRIPMQNHVSPDVPIKSDELLEFIRENGLIVKDSNFHRLALEKFHKML